ncbi:MAG TPA: hypothetical protein DCX67_06140, partial [Opitutae bacterium]|nr:hypothetical protein [Opitutae bacterium]
MQEPLARFSGRFWRIHSYLDASDNDSLGKNAPFRIPQIVKRWCLVLDFRLRERDNQPFKMIAPYGFNPTCILLSAMSVALPLQAMKFELGPMGSLNRIEVQLRT